MPQQRVDNNPAYFNPSIKEADVNPYQSRGIDPIRYSSLTSDRLGNLAALGADAIKITDEAIKTGIREEVTRDVDKIRDTALGVLDASQEKDLPPELRASTDRMNRISRTRENGGMSDIHYYALLDLEARKTRQRFGSGYREYIDSTISRLTGVDPANALLRAQQSAANAANKQADNWQKYLDQKAKYVGIAFPDYYDKEAAGTPYPQATVREGVMKLEAAEQTTKMRRANIGLQREQGNLNKENVDDAMRTEVNGAFSTQINSMTTPYGETYTKFNKMISDVQSPNSPGGADITPEENQQLRLAFGQLAQSRQAILTNIIDKYDPDMGGTYRQLATPGAIKSLYDSTQQELDVMQNAITNKDFGLLTYKKALYEDTMISDQLKIRLNNEYIRTYSALRQGNMLGNFAEIGLNMPDNLAPLTKEISKLNVMKIFSGEANSAKTLKTDLQQSGLSEPEANKASTLVMKDALRQLQTGNANEEATKNAVNFFFGPGNQGFLSRIDKSDSKDPARDRKAARERVYMDLLSPQVLEKIKTVSPEAYQSAIRWAEDSGATLMQDTARDAQEIVTTVQGGNLRYDSTNHIFVLDDFLKAPGDRSQPVSQQYSNVVGRLNMTLKALSNVYKTAGYPEEKINDRLVQFIVSPGGLGINLSAPKQNAAADPKTVLWDIKESVMKYLSNIGSGKASTTLTGKGSATEQPPMEGAKKAPDGNWYIEKNGSYYRVTR